MRNSSLILTFASTFLLPLSVTAQQFTRPDRAWTSSTFGAAASGGAFGETIAGGDSTWVTHLIQGVGTANPAGTAVDATLNTEAANATHAEAAGGAAFGQWHNNGGATADLIFDLTSAKTLQTLHLWQANQTANFNRGVRDLEIFTSSDAAAWATPAHPSWSKVGATRVMSISTGGAITAQNFALENRSARFVRVRALTNHGGGFTGLAEARVTVAGSASTTGGGTAILDIDRNGNGLGDIWEYRFGNLYRSPALVATQDSDGDGLTNREEWIAGTDPLNSKSIPGITLTFVSPTRVRINCTTVNGKYYTLQESTNLTTWTNVSPAGRGNGTDLESNLTVTRDANKFYRVAISDQDRDGDGISDWTEANLAGFIETDATSFGTANDLATLGNVVTELTNGSIRSSIRFAEGWERGVGRLGAQISVDRTAPGAYPLRIPFRFVAPANVNQGEARSTELTLTNGDGAAIPEALTIPASGTNGRINFTPEADATIEAPEYTRVQMLGVPATPLHQLVFFDAQNLPEFDRTFVGVLRPQVGAITQGSGISTLILRGDNAVARVNLKFTNLTGPQTDGHIHVASPTSGPEIFEIPFGQLNNLEWPMNEVPLLPTKQAIIDAIYGGRIYINVHSGLYPDGEIRGDFRLATGSSTFSPPAAAPAIDTTLSNADLTRDVKRFLEQATLGASDGQVAALRNSIINDFANDRIRGYDNWIFNQRLAAPSILQFQKFSAERTMVQIGNRPFWEDTEYGWYTAAFHAKAQLRMKVGYAWSQIMVVSLNDRTFTDNTSGMAAYIDMLNTNGFDNFTGLLRNVAQSPVMGQYLSHLQNAKATTVDGTTILPDENFAREIMQLFSIGLLRMHPDGTLIFDKNGQPIPTYVQKDIQELARVFTGWSHAVRNTNISTGRESTPTADLPAIQVVANDDFALVGGSSSDHRFQAKWQRPMKMFPAFHDDGAKSYLGTNVPAGIGGVEDLNRLITTLVTHPNTAPFIARLLIQRMVTSNPSRGYVFRVAEAFRTSNGNLYTTIRAILLDAEARNLDIADRQDFGKKKEPLAEHLTLYKAYEGRSKLPLANLRTYGMPQAEVDKYAPDATEARFLGSATMSIFRAPTVFNWYLPSYTQPGQIADAGLLAPEFQILSESTGYLDINGLNRMMYQEARLSGGQLKGPKLELPITTTGVKSEHLIYTEVLADYTSTTVNAPYNLRSRLLKGYYSKVDGTAAGVRDGQLTTADVYTTLDAAGRKARIREACVEVLRDLDFNLASGRLGLIKSRAAAGVRTEWDIILDNVAAIRDDRDGPAESRETHLFNATTRINNMMYLVTNNAAAKIQR